MSAASRLRKAFRYPSDEDSEADEPTELDEEHQERLIEALQKEDAAKNELYRNLFLVLPGTTAAYFLFSFIWEATKARHRLLALLSVTSLACTAYVLKFMPSKPAKGEGKGKRAVYRVEAEKGPVDRYLVPCQLGLLAVLQIAALADWWKGLSGQAWRDSLPLIVFGLAMFARQQLAPLDLEELQKARYEFKGA